MRPPRILALLTSFVAAVLAATCVVAVTSPARADGIPLPPSPFGDPSGANDWTCQPTKRRPEPVIIVHGTFGDRKSLLDNLSHAMVAKGFCVYSFDYGNRATGRIQYSARQLRAFTKKVLRATGARKVSMVGHSQGGMMPRYYIKFLGGARFVDDLVGLSPSNHGTAIVANPLNPLTGPIFDVVCPACNQQGTGSKFLLHLNKGDETPGRVSYTQITTRYDEVVVPYTSAYLEPGRRTTNVTVQDTCPLELTEHLTIPMDPAAIGWTLNALTHRGPADPRFRPACGV